MSSNIDSTITSLEFDQTSSYLSVGYSNGAIVILKLEYSNWLDAEEEEDYDSREEGNRIKKDDNHHIFSMDIDDDHDDYDHDDDHGHGFQKELGSLRRTNPPALQNGNIKSKLKYKVVAYFQAHDSPVIQVQWCKGVCSSMLLLSSCVSSIKLWKIQELSSGMTKFSMKKSFEHEETFNINSISLNSDGKTFLSSDEFRVYLWDLSQNQECFNIIDLKPNNMQMLNEVIRVSEFHPRQCNYLMYGTNRGNVKLCDMRISALLNSESSSQSFELSLKNDSIFSDYVNSILDLKFSAEGDGNYFVSRTLGSLVFWDMRKENEPVSTLSLHAGGDANIQAKLYDMYESSAYLDKFPCSFLNDSNHSVITGCYSNQSVIWNPFNNSSYVFRSEQDPTPGVIDYDEMQEENSDPFNAEFHLLMERYHGNELELSQQLQSMKNDKLMKLYNYIYNVNNYKNIHFQRLPSTLFQKNQPTSSQKLIFSDFNTRMSCISTTTSKLLPPTTTNIVATSSLNQLYLYTI